METKMTYFQRTAFCVFIIKILLITNLYAHDEKLMPGGRPDGHAPIGVMGDHMHKKGEYMMSYRYMTMNMEGLLDGGDDISETSALSYARGDGTTHRIIPDSMHMHMHMLGFMYGYNDSITLMGMINYNEKDMTNNTYNMMGTTKVGKFSAHTGGFGDSSISTLIRLSNDNINSHISVGISLPTGSTTEEITALMPSGAYKVIRAPYGMQLGTGTYDVLLGYTLSQTNKKFSWGAQIKYKSALDKHNGWHFGDKLEATSWISYLLNEKLSTAIRMYAVNEGRIDGHDILITGRNPTQETSNYGGRNYNLGISLNMVGQNKKIRGHRVAIELLTPLSQNLNGLQMEKGTSLILAYQKAW